MNRYKLAETESKFAQIIWDNEPISSGELVRKCEEKFNWKKSTTYTVLKKLCQRGIFKNEDAIVTSVITREQFDCIKSKEFVKESFSGSLPKFLAAFMGEKKIDKEEAKRLKDIIDKYIEGE
ncbi:BlaI/MecI/CopY family transcriptional regulator [Hathewaya proteolytica]|uniref:BlaI/MecI/CopY family transcriptional regulator n=1 Tax=Hathewaya proteolytica TaxID=29365 RepID=UPI000933B90A|nr:BlaI/MecI/CopY family transcriptional regulator [Hathewaya proteolytica]